MDVIVNPGHVEMYLTLKWLVSKASFFYFFNFRVLLDYEIVSTRGHGHSCLLGALYISNMLVEMFSTLGRYEKRNETKLHYPPVCKDCLKMYHWILNFIFKVKPLNVAC